MKKSWGKLAVFSRLVVRSIAVVLGLLSLYSLSLLLKTYAVLAAQRPEMTKRWATIILQVHCRYLLSVCSIHVDYRGIAAHDFPTSRALLLTNHVNYLDVILLAARFRLGFVAKKEVADWGGLGRLIRLMNVIFIKRECTYSRVAGLRELCRNTVDVSYCVFPQGTTSASLSLYDSSWYRGQLHCQKRVRGSRLFVGSILYEDHQSLAWIDDMDLFSHLVSVLKRKHTKATVMVEEWTLRSHCFDNTRIESSVIRGQMHRMMSDGCFSNKQISVYARLPPSAELCAPERSL